MFVWVDTFGISGILYFGGFVVIVDLVVVVLGCCGQFLRMGGLLIF